MLENVYISGCENLTDLSFNFLCNLKHLKILSVNDKISNECLQNVIVNCYNLETLSIRGKNCYYTQKYTLPFNDENDVITYDLILWIIKNANKLKSISICKQNSLTNHERRQLLDKYGDSYFPDFQSYLLNNR